ncbi:MAG: LacI family DNA-binding transcriptional regulator [Spirochaetota bacterium]
MKVTIEDIARIAGVSKSTVSMVINNAPSIPDRTKQRIRKIMRENNYFPNSRGRQLASRKSFSIGMLVDVKKKRSFLNPYFYSMIGGAESFICAHDFDLTISNINSTESKDYFLNRFVKNRKVDGIIIPSSVMTRKIYEQLKELNFPFVLIGEVSGYPDISWVDIDNTQAGVLATRHLIDSGYRRIAFIGGNPGEVMSYNRLKGYKNTIKALKVSKGSLLIKEGGGDEKAGRKHMKALISGKPLPDAVICINNYVAYGAKSVIEAAGLKIPDDIGFVTFDDYPLAPYVSPPLTSLDIDTFELGFKAAEIVMERVKEPGKKSQTVLIPPVLIERESTKKESIAPKKKH